MLENKIVVWFSVYNSCYLFESSSDIIILQQGRT